MPFLERYKNAVRKTTTHCEMCHTGLGPKTPRHYHSATSLHLEPFYYNGRLYFQATSTRDGHDLMWNRLFPVNFLSQYFPQNPKDIFACCLKCHTTTHDIERDVANILGFADYIRYHELRGSYTTPEILATLTASLIDLGRPIDRDEQFNRYMALYFPGYL